MPLERIVPSGTRTSFVTVEKRVSTAESGFPLVEEWKVAHKVWMAKLDLSATEALRADQLSARYDSRFVAPYDRDLDPDFLDLPTTRRLTYRGRVFDIVSARLLGTNEGVEIMTLASTARPATESSGPLTAPAAARKVR